MRKPPETPTDDDFGHHSVAQLSCDQALKVASQDAEEVYRDLSGFSIRTAEERDGWHVDYELKGERARGGGPHYIIDPVTGKILTVRYEQ